MKTIQKHYIALPFNNLGIEGNDLFKKILKRLDGIKFTVAGGTALGLYRDKKLIFDDTDIDIDVVWIEGLEEKLRSIFSDFPLASEIFYDDKIQQLAFLPDGIIFDIHFSYLEDGHYICRHTAGELSYPKYFFDEPIFKDTSFGIIPFPGNIDAFLFRKYGMDWMIPQYRKKGTLKNI